MKTFLSLLIFGVVTSAVSAQSNTVNTETARPAFSINTVIAPAHTTGSGNYLLSFSDKDFSNKNYVFYTDSNATVAHLRINGNDVRLTGGHNPENIMTYVTKEYTVTLDVNKNTPGAQITATLVVYYRNQTIVKKVTGAIN